MRRDPRRRRSGPPDRDHRQRRADRLHGPEARLGARPRAGDLAPDRPRPAAQGLRPAAPDRRACDRQGRRRGHDPVRPGGPRLVDRRCSTRSRSTPPGCRRPSKARRSRVSSRPRRRPRPGCVPGRRSSRAAAIRRRTPSASGRSRRASSRSRWGRRASSFAATNAPLVEPAGRVHAFCHAVPGRWHMMSVMLSAAGSLRWFRDALAPGVEFGDLVREAEDVPAGSDGLLFLPYLTGERSPHPDPLARGAFVGLTVGHDRRHLTRAVLEGVAFGLRDGLDLMVEAGIPAAGPDPGVRRWHREPASGARSSPTSSAPRSRRSARPRVPRTARGCSPRSGRAGSRGRGGGGLGLGRSDAGGRARRRRRRVRRGACAVPRALPGPRPDVPPNEATATGARTTRPSSRCDSIARELVLARPRPGFLPRMIIPRTSSGVTSVLVDRVHDPPVVHDADPVRQVEDVVDVVADQEDADPLAP